MRGCVQLKEARNLGKNINICIGSFQLISQALLSSSLPGICRKPKEKIERLIKVYQNHPQKAQKYKKNMLKITRKTTQTSGKPWNNLRKTHPKTLPKTTKKPFYQASLWSSKGLPNRLPALRPLPARAAGELWPRRCVSQVKGWKLPENIKQLYSFQHLGQQL